MLTHLRGVLNPERLAQCRKLLSAEEPWVDGRGTGGNFVGSSKTNMEISQPHPVADQLGTIVFEAIMTMPLFHAAAMPVRISPPSFSRYTAGQFYGTHNDSAILEFNVSGSRLLVRTDLAATLFISEPQEYTGGELVIEDKFGPAKVKLPAGDMVLYPASSLHRVEQVSQGTRLVSFLWIQSMVRDNEHRGILRDLDFTIQELRRSTPENPAILKLINHYHNLLRIWSEV